jgi:putative permease
MDDRDLTIRVAKATAAALAVVALAFGVWQVRSVLILLLLALTFAAAIRPGVEWLERHRVPESVAILLHFLVAGAALALFVWLAVPPALHQIVHALGAPPAHATGVRERVLEWLRRHLHQLPTGTQLLHPVATYGHKAGEAVVGIFFTLAATWYLVSGHDSYIRLLTAAAPESRREQARETYVELDRRLGSYTRLRFLMVFAVGTVLSAGFYVIGLDYWLLVGAFVGVAEIVPIIGPLFGAILVVAVGLPQSLHVVVLSLLWLYAVRLFQDYVVNPHLALNTVGLSPLVTLLSVSVVGILFGPFAVILAVPVTAAVGTLIDVLVLGHEPPVAQPRRSLRMHRAG